MKTLEAPSEWARIHSQKEGQFCFCLWKSYPKTKLGMNGQGKEVTLPSKAVKSQLMSEKVIKMVNQLCKFSDASKHNLNHYQVRAAGRTSKIAIWSIDRFGSEWARC